MEFKKLTTLVFLSIVILSVCATHALKNTDHLRIVFLDVGQGDSILIQTPLGKNILVDTGPTNNLDQKISKYIGTTNRTIDVLLLTHPDLDHVGGSVNILKRYSLKFFVHSGLLAGSTVYEVIAHEVSERSIPNQELTLGDYFVIEPGLFLYVYSPSIEETSFDANEHSLVLKLVYYNTSVLLMGDASKTKEFELAEVFKEGLKSDILKVGHHGSQTSTSLNFLEYVRPAYGIISAGCDNRYGHPHADVLSNLFQFGVRILDTCLYGDIVFESNGQEWTLKNEL